MTGDPLTAPDLPAEAFAAALADLPGMGPARLMALCRAWSWPDAWDRVQTGRVLDHRGVRATCGADGRTLVAAWASAAARIDPAEVWVRHVDAGVGVSVLGGAAYPPPLADDVEPAAVLFHRGDPEVLTGRPRVAIVGTRSCTRYGLDVAYELGRDLAAAGVTVVSGLAVGIDAAAHAGALAGPQIAEEGAGPSPAPPVAIVGSGLDVVYPRRNASLWRRIEATGAVVSEAPLGARPERWRFPARNRLIAALADVVVVVESRERGGSMHTVTEALRRDRVLFAVPGPVRSPASAGTNRLLADGAGPCCGADDVLLALGLSPAPSRAAAVETRPAPDPAHRAILDALDWRPSLLDQLAVRANVELGELAVAVATLEAQGWLVRRGSWLERVARSGP